MKVLRKGNSQKHIGLCLYCNAIIKALRDELSEPKTKYPYEGKTIDFNYLMGSCPECHEKTYFFCINSTRGKDILQMLND